ncbi:DUF2617 family protein [Nocardiopsis sp. NPDC055824]
MRASISAPFVDTGADDLVWTLGHPPTEPLASRSLRVAGARVELRVLGASHQVVVAPDSGGGALVETVACLPGLPGGLPGRAERPDRGGYRFNSLVESLARDELADRVERLHREVADSPGGLLVAFPGDPLAITALHLTPLGGSPLGWRTWHAYPQTGELVTTTSTMTTPPSPERSAP